MAVTTRTGQLSRTHHCHSSFQQPWSQAVPQLTSQGLLLHGPIVGQSCLVTCWLATFTQFYDRTRPIPEQVITPGRRVPCQGSGSPKPWSPGNYEVTPDIKVLLSRWYQEPCIIITRPQQISYRFNRLHCEARSPAVTLGSPLGVHRH